VSKRKNLPVALTIAGSDSGGGAGIQADLKTFASLGVHGTSALTCITAQNPCAVMGIHPCPAAILSRQLDAVFDQLPPAAVKTGMLYSTQIIRVVIERFKGARHPPLIVDPVMVATSGSLLLRGTARRALEQLLEAATLVTPNIPEAGALTGMKIDSEESSMKAARWLHDRFGCAVLLKGGHLRGTRRAVDFFFDGRIGKRFSAPFIRGVSTHGTGCTLSAAITAQLALGTDLPDAVAKGKEFVTMAIRHGCLAAGHFILNSSWDHAAKAPKSPGHSHGLC
jgi:hydroxymethylpyrimidine/phosphomethylpyrimidine kinase